jgi:hypothetical protein
MIFVKTMGPMYDGSLKCWNWAKNGSSFDGYSFDTIIQGCKVKGHNV